MFNPLTPDLSKLTNEELLAKLEELWKRGAMLRYHPAHQQIQQLINSYQTEINRRRELGAKNI
ncbi:MAG TPA: hypothetical protein VFM18_18690 [Methanosarcina sp.]|nr:hypothetical protein [Methanosarcina sp.]